MNVPTQLLEVEPEQNYSFDTQVISCPSPKELSLNMICITTDFMGYDLPYNERS